MLRKEIRNEITHQNNIREEINCYILLQLNPLFIDELFVYYNIVKERKYMSLFLLGMLVMWFCYPLLKATQTTMVVKWNNLTMDKQEIEETTTIGFRTGV